MQVDGLADAAWRLARTELPKGVSDIAPAEGADPTATQQDLRKEEECARSEAGRCDRWSEGVGRSDGRPDSKPALSRLESRAGVVRAAPSVGSRDITRGADALPGEQFAIWVSGRTDVQFRDVGPAGAR